MKQGIFLLIILLMICATLQGSFLRIEDTAVSYGLGSAGVSYLTGAVSTLINPANTYHTNKGEIVFSQYFGPELITCSYLSMTKKFKNQFSGGIVVKAMYPFERIEMLDDYGEKTGDLVSFKSYLIGINCSKKINEKFYGGANVKYVQEKLWKYTSWGFAVDFGVRYIPGKIKDLSIGCSYQNFELKVKDFLQEDYDYPNVLRLGASCSENTFFNKPGKKGRYYLMVDLLWGIKDEADYLSLGSECKVNKWLRIRAGYKLRLGINSQDVDYLRNLKAGMGIKLKKVQIDYSMTPKSNAANQFLHFINVCFSF